MRTTCSRLQPQAYNWQGSVSVQHQLRTNMGSMSLLPHLVRRLPRHDNQAVTQRISIVLHPGAGG